MRRRKGSAIQMGGEQHLVALRLGEIYGSAEAELLPMALHPVEPDQLYVSGIALHSDRLQKVAESYAGPLASASGLRAPGKFARH